MIKVTYKLANLFSLRKFKDSNLCARSYEYPMLTTVRGALLGSLIQRKGVKFAKEHFRELEDIKIFIQVPKVFSKNQEKLRMFSNNSYSKGNVLEKHTDLRTMGVREYVYMDKIVFYVEDTLEYILELLVNIDRIGNSDSIVELESIEEVDSMENILVEWNEEIGYDKKLYDLYDWNRDDKLKAKKKKEEKNRFDEKYLYSKIQKDNNKRFICYVEEKIAL